MDYTMNFSKQVLPEDFVTKFYLRIQHKSVGTCTLFTVYFSEAQHGGRWPGDQHGGRWPRLLYTLFLPNTEFMSEEFSEEIFSNAEK